MLILKWFASSTVRHAWQAAKHVGKILDHQRDLLTPEAVASVTGAVEGTLAACRTGDKAAITATLERLEKDANKWLRPFPHSAWRENVEVALVSIAVAMSVRTFFLQPFKIPTGSMQPTLFGVTQEDLRGQENVKIPGGVAGFFDYWFNGVSYFHVVAKADGVLTYDEPSKLVLFNIKQNYKINGESQPPVWFPPDGNYGRAGLFGRADVPQGAMVRAGEDIVKMRVVSGDHLFVDRVTFNLRRPERGDIVVFETHGITRLPRDQQDTYYIKRLVATGGETVQIGDDRHLRINGQRLDANTPHFEFLYSFDTNQPPTDSKFSGHVNEVVANHFGRGHLAPNFLNQSNKYIMPPRHYLVMGDNTVNSSDGRAWGDFPQERVIGKSFFVYWPIGGTTFNGEERTSRFGWAHR